MNILKYSGSKFHDTENKTPDNIDKINIFLIENVKRKLLIIIYSFPFLFTNITPKTDIPIKTI